MGNYETILVERRDGVGVITLNRPERRNAYTSHMGSELHDAMTAFEADDAIRVMVITGAGRDFCLGADLDRGADTFSAPAGDDGPAPVAEPPTRPWEMATPIIGAINGAAVGVGLTLPMQWDIRIAARDAKVGFVFPRRGLLAEANSLWTVPRLIGVSRAMELLLTGRIFTGEEGAAMGLFSRAVDREQVLPEALALAADIAANTAPMSIALTKRLVYAMLAEPDRDAAHATESAAFHWMGRQPDAAEGIDSFLQRRAPQWTMSKHTPVPELEQVRQWTPG